MKTSTPNLSSPVGSTRRRLEVLVELTLDATLSSTARLILGGLSVEDGRPTVWPTNREIAERHGVSDRTVGGALAAGERAGWIRRVKNRAELVGLAPELAKRVPRGGRPTRRLIVLLWLAPGLRPATSCQQQLAGQPLDAGSNLLVAPAATCRSLARAPDSPSSELRTREERTFVPPPSPPGEDLAPLWPNLPVRVRDSLARMMAAAAAAEAVPGFVPAPAVWEPPKPKPTPTVRMKVEELVAACLGPDQAAGLDALLLWLATELHDAKPVTRAFWARSIPAILTSADGFDQLVGTIMDASSKRFPARWFSACVARGQPGAQKTDPRGQSPNVPGDRRCLTDSPMSNSTRRVNPCPL
jgi:hypothetical protein